MNLALVAARVRSKCSKWSSRPSAKAVSRACSTAVRWVSEARDRDYGMTARVAASPPQIR